jgi:hypothetical protein
MGAKHHPGKHVFPFFGKNDAQTKNLGMILRASSETLLRALPD